MKIVHLSKVSDEIVTNGFGTHECRWDITFDDGSSSFITMSDDTAYKLSKALDLNLALFQVKHK